MGESSYLRFKYQYTGKPVAIRLKPQIASYGLLKMVITNKAAQNNKNSPGTKG